MRTCWYLGCIMLATFWLPAIWGAELQQHTIAAWDNYIRMTEKRVNAELSDGHRFLAMDYLSAGEQNAIRAAIQKGETYTWQAKTPDKIASELQLKDGLIIDWLGVIFIPGLNLDDVLKWSQAYERHVHYPVDVEASKIVSRDGDSTFNIFVRLRTKKFITAVHNTLQTHIYRRYDDKHASSISYATRIAEVANPGTPSEWERPVGNDDGYLWRMNSYWRYQEEPGGVLVECESLSLSRDIPSVVGLLFKHFSETVPQESLQRSLIAFRDGSEKMVGPQIRAR